MKDIITTSEKCVADLILSDGHGNPGEICSPLMSNPEGCGQVFHVRHADGSVFKVTVKQEEVEDPRVWQMEAQARKIDDQIKRCLGADSAFNVRVGAASEVDPCENEYQFEFTIEYGTNTYSLGARSYEGGICEIEVGEDAWVEMTVRSIYMYLFSAECERRQPLHTESK